jgi:hypothetical protein
VQLQQPDAPATIAKENEILAQDPDAKGNVLQFVRKADRLPKAAQIFATGRARTDPREIEIRLWDVASMISGVGGIQEWRRNLQSHLGQRANRTRSVRRNYTSAASTRKNGFLETQCAVQGKQIGFDDVDAALAIDRPGIHHRSTADRLVEHRGTRRRQNVAGAGKTTVRISEAPSLQSKGQRRGREPSLRAAAIGADKRTRQVAKCYGLMAVPLRGPFEAASATPRTAGVSLSL